MAKIVREEDKEAMYKIVKNIFSEKGFTPTAVELIWDALVAPNEHKPLSGSLLIQFKILK